MKKIIFILLLAVTSVLMSCESPSQRSHEAEMRIQREPTIKITIVDVLPVDARTVRIEYQYKVRLENNSVAFWSSNFKYEENDEVYTKPSLLKR